jgi:FtsH-binding integral membrane protein
VEIGLQAAPKTVKDGYYWTDEIVLDVLVFCVVIAFIDEAARQSRQKVIERHWLVLAAALICAGSFAIHHGLSTNRQMTLVSRDLNICAVILDVILWSLLAAARRPDRRLMLLSGGLGLQLTGAIMGEQLRNLSRRQHTVLLAGQLLEVATGFLALYIWWRALRRAPAAERLPA